MVCELEVLLMECDGVVEEKLRSVLEHIWDSIPGKVPMEGGQDIGEYECDITSQGFGEDSG